MKNINELQFKILYLCVNWHIKKLDIMNWKFEILNYNKQKSTVCICQTLLFKLFSITLTHLFFFLHYQDYNNYWNYLDIVTLHIIISYSSDTIGLISSLYNVLV